jgi:hypothetical protein
VGAFQKPNDAKSSKYKIRFEEGVVWENEYPLLGKKVWGLQEYATASKVSVTNC